MPLREPQPLEPAQDVRDGTTEQELASGRRSGTPFLALASVTTAIAVLVLFVLVLTAVAYYLLA
jgi:hypothetical protein